MRGCWARDGARWTSGASAGQAGYVLAEDDRGVQRVPDLGASQSLRRSGAICDDADRGRSAAQLVESTVLKVERHDAVALERGAEAVDRLVHVLAGDAVELFDQAVGGVVQHVVEPFDLVRVERIRVAPLAVGAAQGQLPAHLLDLIPLGGMHALAAAPAAQLEAADVQLGAGLDVARIRSY